ncbi:MAG: glycosyltransferase family 2 protein [Planctomycetaceae bacterium]|nr:glycosyltransferase family 2 protein [Planctomycetaceae bacterium]
MPLLEIICLTSLAVVLYAYVGFPVLILLRSWIWQRPFRISPITPRISLVICAHNEEKSIGAKLENVLALDYPPEHLEVLIASDGSSDGTEEIVEQFTGALVRLLRLPRRGKAAALNAAVEQASGEILVFSDANSMYAPDALRKIVQPFADERVGGVAGNQVYRKSSEDSGAAAAGERGYWNFDRWMKRLQSSAGNVVSATGAIYAVRRSLYCEVPEGVTDDFVTSTRVIQQGYRLVFAENATCHEPVAGLARAEFGRKVRVITRGLRGVLAVRGLLNPLRYGSYSLQLFSHKVLRRLVVFPMMVLAVTIPLLWSSGVHYQVATVLEGMFCIAALAGWLLSRTESKTPRVLAVPFFFCMVNVAVLCAVWNICRGRRIVVWNPHRTSESSVGVSGKVAPVLQPSRKQAT